MLFFAEEEESDVNIWNEEADCEANIIFEASAEDDGSQMEQVKAGTLNKLVERLTSAKSHNLMYTNAFLLTYQSFTTADKFFTKLVQRYNVPRPNAIGDDEFRKTVQLPIQLRVCNVLNT